MSHPMDHDALRFCCGERHLKSAWHDCKNSPHGRKRRRRQVSIEIRAAELADLMSSGGFDKFRSVEVTGWFACALGEDVKDSPGALAGWLAYQIHNTSSWERIEYLVCDTCTKPATWKHAAGGYRCDKCPRPER